MKKQRQNLEIFSLSFLDVISSAFGAVVMLVLLAKNGDEVATENVDDLSSLIQQVEQIENENSQLKYILNNVDNENIKLQTQANNSQSRNRALENKIASDQQQDSTLKDTIEKLKLVNVAQQKAAVRSSQTHKKSVEVGGIPVDSEYVIFIIDTSGSMQRIWPRLISEMNNILEIHPKVKGFQVMNDMGHYLLSSQAGQWIKDSPRIRRAVLDAMRNWMSLSNSSPVEGLEVALKTYARKTSSLSIYILGDDYSGGSYDPVIATLNRLNTDPVSGKRIARVHAVGFITGQNITRFSTLMREVTRQNRGTFIALPR